MSLRRAIHGSRIGAMPPRTSMPTSGSVNGPDVSVTVWTVPSLSAIVRNGTRIVGSLPVA